MEISTDRDTAFAFLFWLALEYIIYIIRLIQREQHHLAVAVVVLHGQTSVFKLSNRSRGARGPAKSATRKMRFLR